MVSRSVFLLALLVVSSSALDISRLLGLSGEEKEEVTSPSESGEQRQLLAQLGQIGAALNPLNVVNAAYSALPTLPAVPKRTVTKTLFIQVTSTQTQYPMCVTAHSVMPPCAALHPEPEPPQHHYDPHDAYHVGSSHGELNHEIAHHPHLGMVGHVPRPGGHHGGHYDAYGYHDEHEYRAAEPFEIQPTAAFRMEASAMPELERDKRAVELEASTPSEPAEVTSEVMRPHPRYLAGLGLGDPKVETVTKTLYMTKVERLINHHVTATMIAHNCIPDQMPFCPRYSSLLPQIPQLNTPVPVHQAPVRPVVYNGDNHHHQQQHHTPTHPLRPVVHNGNHHQAHNPAPVHPVRPVVHNGNHHQPQHHNNNHHPQNGHNNLLYRAPEPEQPAEAAEIAEPEKPVTE